MSRPTWELKNNALPDEGKTIVVKPVDGEGSTALFLRVSQETPPAGSIPLPDGTHALAYLNVCTHMSCRLVRGKKGKLAPNGSADEAKSVVGPCPCHGTSFDLSKDGLVVFGPATQNLPRLDLSRNKSGLTATLNQSGLNPHRETWPQKE